MFLEMASIWEISWVDLTIRMVLSAVLGGLIGFEREWSNHAAGFRTHILVCLGSTTIMLMSIYGFGQFIAEPNVRIDPARLAAQVISGIGFLGAGAILRNGNMIKGLTTAASIWTVAAIGLCVGAGFYIGALLCTLMVLISLYVLNKWEKVLLRHRRYQTLELRVADSPGLWGVIVAVLEKHGVQVSDIKVSAALPAPSKKAEPSSESPVPRDGATLHFKLKSSKPLLFLAAVEDIAKLEGVREVESASYAHMDKKNSRRERKLGVKGVTKAD